MFIADGVNEPVAGRLGVVVAVVNRAISSQIDCAMFGVTRDSDAVDSETTFGIVVVGRDTNDGRFAFSDSSGIVLGH